MFNLKLEYQYIGAGEKSTGSDSIEPAIAGFLLDTRERAGVYFQYTPPGMV